MKVDEIYEIIGEAIASNLEDVQWQQAVLKIYMNDYPNEISFQLYYFDENSSQIHQAMQYYPDDEAVEELFLLFLEGASAWNEATFILEPDGTFSMNFNWNDPEIFVAAKNKDWEKVSALLQTAEENTALLDSAGRTFAQYISQEKEVPESVRKLVKTIEEA